MINIIKDIDLAGEIGKYDLILVGTNTYCTMPQGFQREVMLDYPYVLEENMKTKYADRSKLGTCLECAEEGQPTFSLLFVTFGYNFRPDKESDYLDYEALDKCLKSVNVLYRGRKMATTVIGCTKWDGNGDRERVIKMMEEDLTDVDVDVYDYRQLSVQEVKKAFYDEEMALRGVDEQKRKKMVTERKKKAEERRKKNGHAGY